jgi:hypothetical protein
MKLITGLLVALTVAACQAVILDVPGYATLNGTTDTTYHFKRPFFKFRGLYYGQKPTSETRFLVNEAEESNVEIQVRYIDYVHLAARTVHPGTRCHLRRCYYPPWMPAKQWRKRRLSYSQRLYAQSTIA